MKQVCYFGMGPSETYIDKHHAGYHSCFKGTAASMHEDYIRPQENGSHYDCDYVTVKGKGLRLTVACADPDPERTFSFNASVYTQEELAKKRHNYELEPCNSTVLCVDHQMAGIGSNSCGPELSEKYQVSADAFSFSFSFSFMLKPEGMCNNTAHTKTV
jgi:beta-galactosidase